MSETKKNRRRSNEDADENRSPDRVTDGPTGLRRFEDALRSIFRAGRDEAPPKQHPQNE